jgi:outer membrane immunogenic protein
MRMNINCPAGIAMLLAAMPASAADLPAPKLFAAPSTSASPYNWQGSYVGLLIGGAWGQTQTATAVTSSTLALFPPIIPTIDAAGSNTLASSGAIVGGQIGYNFAVAERFILGAEADLAWTSLSGSKSTAGIVPIFNGPFAFDQRLRSDWLGTVRGRAGFAAFDHLLAYATGGLAVTGQHYASDFGDAFNEFQFYRHSSTRLGWTLGAGLEYEFGAKWSAKLEYLHTEFAGISGTGYSLLADGSTALVQNQTGRQTIDSVRFGINYHMSASAPAAVVAKY